MTALQALKAARNAGIELAVDDTDLILDASAPPPKAVLDMLSRYKTDILVLLQQHSEGMTGEGWHDFFEDQVEFIASGSRLSRPAAEARAFSCCIAEWLNRNPVHSTPDRCLGCGEGVQGGCPLLPFGTETAGHAWLHARCWRAWHASRREGAVAALEALGINEGNVDP